MIKYIEVAGKIIVERRIRVYARPPQRTLDTLRCTQNIDREVVAAIPCDKVGRVTVRLFQSTSFLSNAELKIQYTLHEIESYPMAQIAFNKACPEFARKYLNITNFVDRDGNWCYVAFDEHSVRVHRSTGRYSDGLWFLGISTNV